VVDGTYYDNIHNNFLCILEQKRWNQNKIVKHIRTFKWRRYNQHRRVIELEENPGQHNRTEEKKFHKSWLGSIEEEDF